MLISYAIIAPSIGSSYYLVVLTLAMFIALAYMTTVVVKKSKLTGGKGKNIQIVEKFYLSTDKILMIVLVGNIYYLMSYDKTGLKMMDKLDDFTPNEVIENELNFSSVLEKIKLKKSR